jgi:hypothetical protein
MKKRKLVEDCVDSDEKTVQSDDEKTVQSDVDDHDETAVSFATQLMEQVVRGRITVKGVNDVLKIFNHHYGKFLSLQGTRIPSSWYIVRKLATKGENPNCDIRDVCPDCDFVFPHSANRDPTCTICGKETRWHPMKVGEAVRQAAYFDVEQDLRRFFEVEIMADALVEFAAKQPVQGTIRKRQLDGAVDGTILHDLHFAQEEDQGNVPSDEEDAEVKDDDECNESSDSSSGSEPYRGGGYTPSDTEGEDDQVYDNQVHDEGNGAHGENGDLQEEADEPAAKYTVYISLTADGTDFAKWVNKSFTPVTSKILNLDSTLRSRMSNIQLHAILPESIKDYNSLLRPVVLQFHKHRPTGGHPIVIHHPRTGALMHLYIHMAYTVNDLRGVPGCTGGCHAPTIEGSCVACKVRGVWRHHRTVLPASVRLLPRNSDLRNAWERYDVQYYILVLI